MCAPSQPSQDPGSQYVRSFAAAQMAQQGTGWGTIPIGKQPTAPDLTDAAVQAAGKTQATGRGRSSTFLGGGVGLGDTPPPSGKSFLGG